jgi:transposase
MTAMKPRFYVPACLREFQGFFVRDIKDFSQDRRVEVHLEQDANNIRKCHKCKTDLSGYHDSNKITAKHLKMMGWQVEIIFYREKHQCPKCNKVRSQYVSWMSPSSPHVTLDLAWWLSRLSEVTSVLSVSKLESLDKSTCYKVDKYILRRLLQGYKIPKVTAITVDEVYARSPKQQKPGETRGDLFLTVVVDLKTRKVIWVGNSRRREALDEFFELIGQTACDEIKVVCTDQHEDYTASVNDHCKNAVVVFDRFHLVQNFNEAINNERKQELAGIDPKGEIQDLMNGKYRYVFLKKAINRTKKDHMHIREVARLNSKMGKLEIIKEYFHRMFECTDQVEAQEMLNQCFEWACQIKAPFLVKYLWSLLDEQRLWNYFKYKVTTSLSEGINRIIKGLKWQAYGYRDMEYFKLKILQKAGYLNSKYHQNELNLIWSSH